MCVVLFGTLVQGVKNLKSSLREVVIKGSKDWESHHPLFSSNRRHTLTLGTL